MRYLYKNKFKGVCKSKLRLLTYLSIYFCYVMLQISINNIKNRQDNILDSKPTVSIILFITVLFKVSEQNSSFFFVVGQSSHGKREIYSQWIHQKYKLLVRNNCVWLYNCKFKLHQNKVNLTCPIAISIYSSGSYTILLRQDVWMYGEFLPLPYN